MTLLQAIALEPFVPGPQILMALAARNRQVGLGAVPVPTRTIGTLLGAGILLLIGWSWFRTGATLGAYVRSGDRGVRRLRRNPARPGTGSADESTKAILREMAEEVLKLRAKKRELRQSYFDILETRGPEWERRADNVRNRIDAIDGILREYE